MDLTISTIFDFFKNDGKKTPFLLQQSKQFSSKGFRPFFCRATLFPCSLLLLFGVTVLYLGANVERNSVNTASRRSSSSGVLYLSPLNHIKSYSLSDTPMRYLGNLYLDIYLNIVADEVCIPHCCLSHNVYFAFSIFLFFLKICCIQ